MILYDYWRSSAAYRVRIALNLKGLEYRQVPVDLLAGEHRGGTHLSRNPQGLVPALDTGTRCLTQSMAICEYLEQMHPEPPLLPGDPEAKAQVRAIAQAIACEIHPLNNPRVLNYLVSECGFSEQWKLAWYRHWIAEGFAGVEAMLQQSGRNDGLCFGNTPTLADACLVPQVYNAQRFHCSLDEFPRIRRVADGCAEFPAFQRARPEAQPDARVSGNTGSSTASNSCDETQNIR